MPTAPGADGLAGKEVCVCMHKASVAKALMPEMQVGMEGRTGGRAGGRAGGREDNSAAWT